MQHEPVSKEISLKIILLVLLWGVVFVLSFVLPRFIEPTGSGFTRGMNRLPALFGLQCLALLVAIGTAALGYRSRAELSRLLLAAGFFPLALHLLLIIFVVGFYLAAAFRII